MNNVITTVVKFFQLETVLFILGQVFISGGVLLPMFDLFADNLGMTLLGLGLLIAGAIIKFHGVLYCQPVAGKGYARSNV